MNLSDKVETRRETFYKLTNSEVAPEAPSVGGRNLLTGTRDWNSNIKRWSSNNNGVWHDEAEDYNNLKVKSTTDGWNGWHQNVFVKAGEYYTLSYYAKSDTNISVKNSLIWEQSPIFEGPVATFDGNNDISNNITTEWKRHSRTVKITGNGSLQWRIEYNDRTLPSGKWYIAGMKLEERSSASNYSVAPEDLGWTMTILVPNQSNRYLWKFEYIYYSDGTVEVTDPINLSVAGQNGEDGKNSYIHTAYANITKKCNENESFTLTTETIMRFGYGDKWVYKTFGPGTYTANNTTFGKDPYSGKIKQCDAVTDFSITDSTGRSWLGTYNDNSVNAASNPSYYTWQLTKGDRGDDGVPGKDGVGLRSTLITYGLSKSETDKPTTWYSQVPTLTKGDYLWTKTVWTYTDNTSETGYQKTYIARDGNDGNDGIPGKDGVGIKSTTIAYASSTSGTTRPTSGWSSTIPNVPAGQYLWTKTVWTYTDNTSETGYSVAKMGENGKNSYIHTAYANITKKCNENESFTLTTETIMRFGYGDKWVYKTFGPGTYTANNTTFGKDPYSGKIKQCDAVTDFSITDSTGRSWLGTYNDNSVNAASNPSYYTWQLTKGDRGDDGVPGKDGVGLRSTLITYGLSKSETDKPTTWYSQVPTLTKGDYLWTKTVWTYTDNTSETGYQKTYIARDGNDGNDGIPGKDGVGIKSTTIAYASSTSGTTRPTSGWSSTIPNVPAGQYLWTKTVWTYTDNTSETGYSVAKMGENGVSQLTTWTFYKLTNTTSAPQVVPIGSSTNLSHLGPNNVWTPYKEMRAFSEGWNIIDFDKIAKSDIIPDKPFTWYLQASFDGVSNFNGSTDFGITFENWYVNSTGSNVFNPLGIKSFTASKFSATNDTAVNNYFDQSITWTVPRAVYDAIPEGGFLNLRIRIDRFTKLFYHAKNSYVTYGIVPSDPAQKGLGNYSTYGWKASPEVSTQALPYLWMYQIQFYDNGREVAIPPTLIGAQGSDGRTPYMHFAYADDNRGTNFSLTDNNQRYRGYYSDYTEADSTDYRRYRWVDRLANVQVSTKNLILKSNDFSNPHKQSGDKTEVTSTNEYFILKSTGYTANSWGGISWNMSISKVKAGEEFSILMPVYIDSSINLDSGFSFNIKNHTLNSFAYDYSIPTNKKDQWFNVAITFKAVNDIVFDSYPFYVYLVKNGLVRIKPPMLVHGNVIPIDHTSAPEDVQDQIGDKADSALTQEQINALAEKNALIQAEMEAKASMDTVNQWITAYQNYVNANNADKKKSEQALQDASNRLLQVQYDVKDLKHQWNFIDTYMSVQNEGLIIGKKDGSAYAKFSNDRISLFSGNSEVMYISQGTLNIANGIFTKTIQIGRFRFETHPADVDMLVIRYLGG